MAGVLFPLAYSITPAVAGVLFPLSICSPLAYSITPAVAGVLFPLSIYGEGARGRGQRAIPPYFEHSMYFLHMFEDTSELMSIVGYPHT